MLNKIFTQMLRNVSDKNTFFPHLYTIRCKNSLKKQSSIQYLNLNFYEQCYMVQYYINIIYINGIVTEKGVFVNAIG